MRKGDPPVWNRAFLWAQNPLPLEEDVDKSLDDLFAERGLVRPSKSSRPPTAASAERPLHKVRDGSTRKGRQVQERSKVKHKPGKKSQVSTQRSRLQSRQIWCFAKTMQGKQLASRIQHHLQQYNAVMQVGSAGHKPERPQHRQTHPLKALRKNRQRLHLSRRDYAGASVLGTWRPRETSSFRTCRKRPGKQYREPNLGNYPRAGC